jgi:hypothetical protein
MTHSNFGSGILIAIENSDEFCTFEWDDHEGKIQSNRDWLIL